MTNPANLVSIVLLTTDHTLSDINSILDRLADWRLATYAHEHQIELAGPFARMAWGGYIHGYLGSATLHFALEDRRMPKSFYRVTLTYPDEVQTLFRNNDEAGKALKIPFDRKLAKLITLLNGTIVDDQD